MINSQQLVPFATSFGSPAIATRESDFVLAWSSPNQSIHWSSGSVNAEQTGYNWSSPEQIPNFASSDGPSLATMGEKVWMAWKGEGFDTRIFVASLTGMTWSPGTEVSQVGTRVTPALTATDSELFLTWKGINDNIIYWCKSSDGINWTEQAPVPGALSIATPALAGYKGVVYMAWMDENDTKIYLSHYSVASRAWSMPTRLSENFETQNGPALAVGHTGNLHLVWRGQSGFFLWESWLTEGSANWIAEGKVVSVNSPIQTDMQPVLASQVSPSSTIMLAWKLAGLQSVWVAPLDPLGRILPLPPGSLPYPPGESVIWTLPETGFGSGPNNANFSFSLKIVNNGTVNFAGVYNDTGNTLGPSPTQDYVVAAVLLTSDKKTAFTISHTGSAPAASSDSWNLSSQSQNIINYWPAIINGATVTATASNQSDIGSLLGVVLADIETGVEWAVEIIELFT